MAIFYPSLPLSFNDSPAEQLLFERFNTLPDEYHIFYSIRWVNPGMDEIPAHQGEADFVIFHAQKGILVLEVKGGLIRYERRQWYQTNRATLKEREIEDPEVQANRSKFFILSKIKANLLKNDVCMVCHAVCFPDLTVNKEGLPFNYSQEILLDESNIDDLKRSIDNVFSFWSKTLPQTKLSLSASQKVIDIIAPIYRTVRSFSAEHESRENKIIRLSSIQTKIIDYLDEQQSAAIAGVAGSGKTVVAIEKAKSLARYGQNVIFLCYNSALRKFLQEYHAFQNIEYHTFHSLAAKFIRSDDINDLPFLFLQELSSDESTIEFDNIIIDEGQDFENDWLEWLQLKTNGVFYVFYDVNQTINQSELPQWFSKAECRLVLKQICRNTRQISRTALRFIDSKRAIVESDIHGPVTQMYQLPSKNVEIDSVFKIVNSLMSISKYNPRDIAIVHMNSFDFDAWSTEARKSRVSISETISANHVCISTIRRFKGLEAKVVIVVGVDPKEAMRDDWKNRLYVGCSRAKHELHLVFLPMTDDDITNMVRTVTGKSKLIGDKDYLTRILNSQWKED